ncbi:phosphoribosyltransferase family protein [Salinactinospora qingdaonensis]|uniref:Phosphoribosyltransferase family protein n=1 Tax=Salinactinospora qingdaonensis TaxID=702744 RepID=A0ABP7F0D0_9ACTN
MKPLPVSLPFTDRAEAGRHLADRVGATAINAPIVLALPRGGVPVGAELARRLRAPLDALVVRKVGVPGHPELGVGALTEDGHVCFDDTVLARLHLSREEMSATVEAERSELDRRLKLYRGERPPPDLRGRDVIVVDDGVATGGTARAALRMARRQQPARLTLAVPVAAQEAVATLRPEADEIVVLTVPENFHAVGEWYRDFTQLTDSQVLAELAELAEHPASGVEPGTERPLRLTVAGVELDGDLTVPPAARGTVLLGSCQGRSNPRERAMAAAVRQAGYATLVLDLRTQDERDTDPLEELPTVEDAGQRLAAAATWLRQAAVGDGERIGLLASGDASAPALVATARCAGQDGETGDIAAVVVHGGRLDLAESALPHVRAPTLVLVEGDDSFMREITEWALAHIGGPYEIRTVAGAEQLLRQPHEWRAVGDLAAHWLQLHL